MNKHEAAQLHLLPMLSRYRWMSESVQHDEQCSSLHAEGLKELHQVKNIDVSKVPGKHSE